MWSSNGKSRHLFNIEFQITSCIDMNNNNNQIVIIFIYVITLESWCRRAATTFSWPCCTATSMGVNPSCKRIIKTELIQNVLSWMREICVFALQIVTIHVEMILAVIKLDLNSSQRKACLGFYQPFFCYSLNSSNNCNDSFHSNWIHDTNRVSKSAITVFVTKW